MTENEILRRAHWVSPPDAVSEIRTQTGLSQQQAEALLDRFVADGLLSETVGHGGTAWIDVVTFPYQRFGDQLIARQLLEAHLNTSSETAIRRGFYANRPLGKISCSTNENASSRSRASLLQSCWSS